MRVVLELRTVSRRMPLAPGAIQCKTATKKGAGSSPSYCLQWHGRDYFGAIRATAAIGFSSAMNVAISSSNGSVSLVARPAHHPLTELRCTAWVLRGLAGPLAGIVSVIASFPNNYLLSTHRFSNKDEEGCLPTPSLDTTGPRARPAGKSSGTACIP